MNISIFNPEAVEPGPYFTVDSGSEAVTILTALSQFYAFDPLEITVEDGYEIFTICGGGGSRELDDEILHRVGQRGYL